jgi:hypothetical protein
MFRRIRSAILRELKVILMKLLYYVIRVEMRWKQCLETVCVVGSYQLKDPSDKNW